MDHSSLSQIDQQVLIECLLFAGLDARHFGRCGMSTEQGLCPLQLALQAHASRSGNCLSVTVGAAEVQRTGRTEVREAGKTPDQG